MKSIRSKIAVATMGAAVLAITSPAGAQVVGTNDTGNCFPFGCELSTYQQVYSASNFSGAGFLNQINFFHQSGDDLVTGTFDIYVSTTSVTVGALDETDFDGNLGLDNTLFGSFALSGAAPAVLSFAGSPFFYDPTAGNLLLDFRITGATDGAGTTAFYWRGDGDGGLYSRAWQTLGAGLPDSDIFGLVTEFEFSETVVPEPATMTLLATGLFGLAGARRKKAKR